MLVDVVSGHAEIPLRTADIAVAVPLALYMIGLWFIRDRFVLTAPASLVLPVFAALILITGFWLPATLELMALLTVAAVFLRAMLATRARRLAAGRA